MVENQKVMSQKIIDQFHRLFYDKRVFKRCKWLGNDIWKCPLDLWLYQEIIFKHKPELIIETGSYSGASANFMSSMMSLSGYEGKVISIDIVRVHNRFPNVEFITGSSTDPKIVKNVADQSENKKTMVVLDSDHRKSHVLKELIIYSKLVSKGQYLIVEDTNLNGHPVLSKGFNGEKPGPMEAVEDFMKNFHGFTIDENMHKFLLTMHPNGFLFKDV